MKELLLELNQRPIAYYPFYRHVTGSTTTAILLSQIMYWFSKYEKFYHTDNALIEETHLTKNELRTSKEALKKLPFLEMTLKGNPPKTHYKIDWEEFNNFMQEQALSLRGSRTYPSTLISGIHNINLVESTNSYNKETIKNSNNIPDSSGDQVIDKKKDILHARWIRWAEKYIKDSAIQRGTPPDPKKWGRKLRSFCTHENISFPRMKKVLFWYCRQYDRKKNPYSRKFLPKWVPQTNSMSGFCEKFFDIECAMLRMEEEGLRKGLTFDDLIPYEQKAFDIMENYLEDLLGIHIDTLPQLVRDLNASMSSKIHLAQNLFKSSVSSLYIKSLFNSKVYFVGYAMWIKSRVLDWAGWKGDLSIFHPDGPHFKRYIQDQINRQGLTYNKAMRRFLGETKEN